MGEYIGVIHFKKPIPCIKEVSGKQFRSQIAGKDILIIFPSIPDNYDGSHIDLKNGDLVVPNNLFNGNVNWGFINSFPQCLFSVNAALCYLSANQTEIKNIYEDFPCWREKLTHLHTINTGNYIQPRKKIPALIQGGGFDDGLRIFELVDRKKLNYIKNLRTPEVINVSFNEQKEAYSIETISSLFTNVGKQKEIALAYELLITAYYAMERRDFRSSVILGGSAVEKAILERMKQEYTQTTQFEHDKEKHRMLGGKFRWLSEKNIIIPVTDFQSSIIDVRNNATHDGICPSFSETKQCLEKCKILIEQYQPQILEQ